MEQILDSTEFDQALAETDDRLALFRDALKQGSERLTQGFTEGVPVSTLISLRAKMIDSLLVRAWKFYIPANHNTALIAVGGYGRGELHPASDIDLMILLGDAETQPLRDRIGQLLTFFWDIGLEVGHSVRSVDECVREAGKEITIATNLLESRKLTGPRALYLEMCQATGPDRIWPADQFFKAKLEEQKQRYAKYDDTAYNLEPNIKEGPGGLRDTQMVGWVTKRHFNCNTMHALVGHGFLTETEYDALMEGRSLLWKIRFALHILTGRHEDRLLFDYQQTLAEQFGFVGQEHNLAVEQFMQQYYRTVIGLGRLNERLLQLFEEAILLRNQPVEIVPVNDRFQARNGFIEVVDAAIFKEHPSALLEIFLLLQLHPELKGVSASTIRLIRTCRHLIDDEFRQDPRNQSLFMEIMRQPGGVSQELRRMNRYGILAAYLPLFANIVGRMQYDLFHVYTVDEHTLFVIRNLRRFALPEYARDFPLCSRIIEELPKPELLYLAGLFHDIAKGRGGNHSLLGARDAWNFCKQHGLNDYDSKLVSWLVEKHLTISMTAQREDTSDPEVVHRFACEMGDIFHLNYLYLLTVADMRATDPKKWNPWKDSLLRELYLAAKRALLRGLQQPQVAEELARERQTEAYDLLEQHGIGHEQVRGFWLTLNQDYFLHASAGEIAWHTETALSTKEEDLPVVLFRRRTEHGGSEVFIYCKDQTGLFPLTTTLLDQLCLNVVAARIKTTDNGLTLNSYQVLEENGKAISSQTRKREIIATLRQGIRQPEQVSSRFTRRRPRQHKHFPIETRIDFAQDPSNQQTIMKLVTADRPGLLAQVGHAFATCSISLHNAKIATIGAEVEDTFFITNRKNRPLSGIKQFECLEANLLSRLKKHNS